jgi:DUF438 domain-containing protein
MDLIRYLHERDTKTIEILGHIVLKVYRGLTNELEERHKRIKNIYDQLSQRKIANVDTLVYSSLNRKKGELVMLLKPRGINTIPATTQQVVDAVSSVLQALKASPLFYASRIAAKAQKSS